MAGIFSSTAAALADQSIRWVAITWVNHAGAALVKVVPLAGFDAAVNFGVGFSPVADAFGVDGSIDPAHRLARPDQDLRLRADPEAVALLEPGSGWAWAPGERWERSGLPYAADQRQFCRRQQQEALDAGVEVRAGFELEWLVAKRTVEGLPSAAVSGGPYGADRLMEGLDYATALLEGLEAAGVPWLQFHPEYGCSQFELSLAPGSPLEAADRLVRARLIVQRITRRFGWHCSFSPKPWPDQVGNGGHLHLSVRRHGEPLLQGGQGPAGLREPGAAVIAALLDGLPALMALACPQESSYRRLIPSAWSAPFQVWGVENREAALRLIPTAADQADAHLELKVSDLAANPYLLLGSLQALVLDGLQHQRRLPPAVVGDPAALPAGEVLRLPTSLAEASARFAANPLLRSSMGEALHGSLIDSQAAEVRRCQGMSEREIIAAGCWWPVVGPLA